MPHKFDNESMLANVVQARVVTMATDVGAFAFAARGARRARDLVLQPSPRRPDARGPRPVPRAVRRVPQIAHRKPVVTLARDVSSSRSRAGALLRTLSSHESLRDPPARRVRAAFSAVVLIGLFNPDAARSRAAWPGFASTWSSCRCSFWATRSSATSGICRSCSSSSSSAPRRGGRQLHPVDADPRAVRGLGAGLPRPRLWHRRSPAPARCLRRQQASQAVRPFGLGSDIGGGAVAAALALPALLALLMVAAGAIARADDPAGHRHRAGDRDLRDARGDRHGRGLAVAFALIAATSRNVVAVDRRARRRPGARLRRVRLSWRRHDHGPAALVEHHPDRVFSTFSEERGTSVSRSATTPRAIRSGSASARSGRRPRRSDAATLAAQQLNTETEWNFLVLELGLLGARLPALNLRLWCSRSRASGACAQSLRLHLAALDAPLFGLLAAGFAGPTTASVPPAPYLVGRRRAELLADHRLRVTPVASPLGPRTRRRATRAAARVARRSSPPTART